MSGLRRLFRLVLSVSSAPGRIGLHAGAGAPTAGEALTGADVPPITIAASLAPGGRGARADAGHDPA